MRYRELCWNDYRLHVTFGNHFRQLPLLGLCGEANHLLRFTSTNRESSLMRATRNDYFSRELVCRLIVNISNVGAFVKRTNSRRAHSFRKHPSSTRLRNARLTSPTLFPSLTHHGRRRSNKRPCLYSWRDLAGRGPLHYKSIAKTNYTHIDHFILSTYSVVEYGLHFSPIRIWKINQFPTLSFPRTIRCYTTCDHG
jgi:hypothetical protein